MVGLSRRQDPATLEEDPLLTVVTRKQWNAHPPQEHIPQLFKPVSAVRFTHTGTTPCGTFDECKRALKKMQFEQMDTLGLKDICHNFMIGGAGWIFEGRGWDYEPEIPPINRVAGKQSLQIAYIGDFEDETPPADLVKAAMELLVYATTKGIFLHFYSGSHLN